MKYQKKPVIVEAFRYGFDPKPEWFLTSEDVVEFLTESDAVESFCNIKTFSGTQRAEVGDFIIHGLNEIYPCKEDVFWQIYDRVEATELTSQ